MFRLVLVVAGGETLLDHLELLLNLSLEVDAEVVAEDAAQDGQVRQLVGDQGSILGTDHRKAVRLPDGGLFPPELLDRAGQLTGLACDVEGKIAGTERRETVGVKRCDGRLHIPHKGPPRVVANPIY